MAIQESFSNLTQVTAEDCAVIPNLTTANSAFSELVALYANRLSAKEVDN